MPLSGRGRDFIWLWMREARSRGFILLAPDSKGNTWSFNSNEDASSITAIINKIKRKWPVDEHRMLLTGFSDGAIYSLNWGLQKQSQFSAIVPISGVLHPIDLSHAKDMRIYLVHGTLDWMFSINFAHQSHRLLKLAGADIIFREIENLSHTYPREENDGILKWFDSKLALPDL